MPDALVLARAPALPVAEDYAALREEGVAHVQQLAGTRWTDHNAHDPGITVLEAACYALTDLGYRAGFSVPDLLASSGGGTVHTARQALTTGPVTLDDLRRRLVDVPGVADAFVEPHTRTAYGLGPDGLTETGGTVRLGGLLDVSLVLEARVGPGATERSGPPARGETGSAVLPSNSGLVFEAADDAVIESVAVYAARPVDTTGDVRFRVALVDDASGDTLAEIEATVDEALVGPIETDGDEIPVGPAVCVPLGFRVEAGRRYRLVGRGAGARLWRGVQPDVAETTGRAVRIAIGGDGPNAAPRFFYDWRVRPLRLDGAVLDRQAVLAEVARRLDAERGLCQDVASVCVVEPEEVALCAEIDLHDGADAATVAAQIHHAIERFVAPPVEFYTAAELLARGHSADAIFEGPRLDHGLLDPDEWAARRRRCRLHTSDVLALVLGVEGVASVRSASLLSYVDCRPRANEEWVLELVSGRTPVYAAERASLAFFERGLPTVGDPQRAAEALAALRRTDRPARLQAHVQDFPVPLGQDRAATDYWPLQNDLPPTYAVGTTPVRPSAPVRRHAQSAQLKGYLSFFEQVLADGFAQLGTVGRLLSWAPTAADAPTYAVQPVEHVDGLDVLYTTEPTFADAPFDWAAELTAITESPDAAVDRRLRLFEHLLARHGASFAAYQQVQPSDGASRRRVAEDKRLYLEAADTLDAERALGADATASDDLGGFARRVYALLGMRGREPRRLANPHIRLVGDVVDRDVGDGSITVVEARFVIGDGEGGRLFEGRPVVLANTADVDEARAAPGPADVCVFAAAIPEEHEAGDVIDDVCRISEPACRAVTALLDLALAHGADADNYRDDGGRPALVHRCDGDAEGDVLGHVVAETDPADTRDAFARASVGPGDEGFHVIEHVLMRPRSDAELAATFLPVQTAPGCDRVVDPYSYRASVVLPAWSPRFRDLAFRRTVEATLRREAPAHVILRICWISHRQMRALEAVLEDWRRGLAALRRLGCPVVAGTRPSACPDAAAPPPPCQGPAATVTGSPGDTPLRSGIPPLPASDAADAAYAATVRALADALRSLVTVYPAARLLDCTGTGARDDVRPVTLGATQLGSL